MLIDLYRLRISLTSRLLSTTKMRRRWRMRDLVSPDYTTPLQNFNAVDTTRLSLGHEITSTHFFLHSRLSRPQTSPKQGTASHSEP